MAGMAAAVMQCCCYGDSVMLRKCNSAINNCQECQRRLAQAMRRRALAAQCGTLLLEQARGVRGLGADEAVDQHGSEVRILRRIHAKIYEKTALRARRDVNAARGRRLRILAAT